MNAVAHRLKVLGDPTRLRVLRLLSRQALNVGELTVILGLAQPSVSKQLAELRRAGLVEEERAGGYAFYRLAAGRDPLWKVIAAELDRQDDGDGDLARLAEVIRRRRERGDDRNRLVEPGRSWPAWARALGWLIPDLKVVDLGCGDGALTAEIARWAGRVVAVDRDRERLAAARRRFERLGMNGIETRCESMDALSLPDASFDVAVLSQALHYVADPVAALAEARRVLVPGGRILLLDLGPHGEEWVRQKLAHVHLGFRRDDIERHLEAAGFESAQVEDMPKGSGQPFRVLVATALRPAGRQRAGRDRRPARETAATTRDGRRAAAGDRQTTPGDRR